MSVPVFDTTLIPLLNSVGQDVVISGVPFDQATSGRSGSRFGPMGNRKAFANVM